ncbi:MAG: lipid-A-disaccharide synthase [Desulfuromonadaceae bacterium]|nr:lipid-A-disaccharide synthase [Desulfuromonadaceae bacterium]
MKHNREQRHRKALIVTGEASGDLLGSHLIRAAKTLDPDLAFYGVAGPRMAQAGCEVLIDSSELAVMGLVEVVRHLPRIWRVYRRLKSELRGPDAPDVLILIDSPDFNLRLATLARKAGVPVLYYVSPQVWAWRRGRVHRIARDVDKLAAILPFEPDYYRGLDIDVQYVGHPLLDEIPAVDDAAAFRARHGLTDAHPLIGLLPGSRRNELHYAAPTLFEAAARLKQRYPQAGFLLPLAPGVACEPLVALAKAAGVPVTMVDQGIYEVAATCDVVLAVSGTVTLQVALMQTPMVILYKGSPLTYAIGRRLVNIEFFGLPNIVVGRGVVRELLQDAATPEALFEEVRRILEDDHYARTMRDGLREIREKMGAPGCAGRVAHMASDLSRGKRS